MSALNVQFAEIAAAVVGELHLIPTLRVLAAAVVLSADDPSLQILDSGGVGRNVDLPAEASSRGKLFIINAPNAVGALTVRNPALATIDTIAVTNTSILFCDGTTWRTLTGS